MKMNDVYYQIFPIGMTGAPENNDFQKSHRILQVRQWIPHLKRLNVTGVLFNPVFQSESHGYNTIDYRRIDDRLGTNEDFVQVCNDLHENGLTVLLDGVFNHVGRQFWAFQDVKAKKWDSPYCGWFNINFDQDNGRDGFSYQDWEGHQELVKFNLANPDLRQYLFASVDEWIHQFHIDGLRLDVAYCIDHDFLKALRDHVKAINPDFFLFGEMIGGDYNSLLREDLVDSVTNYECYKGMYSSMNSHNLFEIGYSLNRQFGKDPWDLYTGRHLWNFVDNHDVTRIASQLADPRDLPLIYSMLLTMPGIPCIYYGSEWGIHGTKDKWSDAPLRPAVEQPEWNALTNVIASLNSIHSSHPALYDGDYTEIYKRNEQWAYLRSTAEESILYLINIAEAPVIIDIGEALHSTDLLTNTDISYENGIPMDAKSFKILLVS